MGMDPGGAAVSGGFSGGGVGDTSGKGGAIGGLDRMLNPQYFASDEHLRALGKSNEVPRDFQPLLAAETAATLFNLQQGQDAAARFPQGSFFDPTTVATQVGIRDRGQTALGETALRGGIPAFQAGLSGLQTGIDTGFVDTSVIQDLGQQLQGVADFQFSQAAPDVLEASAVSGDLRGSNVPESLGRLASGIGQATVANPLANISGQLFNTAAQNRLAATNLATQLPSQLTGLFTGPTDTARLDIRNLMGFPAAGTQAAGGAGGIPFVSGQGPTALQSIAPLIGALATGKCEIAKAVYGPTDPRVDICRHMLHTKLVHGKDFSNLYNATCEAIAPFISPTAFAPFFDAMIEEAVNG